MVWSPIGILLALGLAAAAGLGGWLAGRRSRREAADDEPGPGHGGTGAAARRRLRLTLESLPPGEEASSAGEILHRVIVAVPETAGDRAAAPEAVAAPDTRTAEIGGVPVTAAHDEPAPPAPIAHAPEPLPAPPPAVPHANAAEPPQPPEPAREPRSWRAALTLGNVLFWLSLAVYALTRLIRLPSFPIYFFSDEAVQTVLASDFLRDGLRDFLGQAFPTYFANGSLFNLSTSVYLQVIPTLLFGKSVWITRGTAALATVIGTAAVGLTLRDVFRLRSWWIGVLLLAVTPAWYLHSRTAFETSLMVSFYAWFLYFYLRYRCGSPRNLYPALLCGALAFYSYSPGQLVVVGTGVLFLVADGRYHWQNRRIALRGLLVLILLILPYVRFQLTQGRETYYHLRMLDTYLLQPIPAGEKLAAFWANYTRGISPAYWYYPNSHDLPRHLMKGYGHIHRLTLPLALLGLIVSLRSLRSPQHRALLLSLLAAPLGASIVGVGVTRTLSFVVPAALITSIGTEAVLNVLARRLAYLPLALATFGLASAGAFYMLGDSLRQGPTWYHDYGLGGMQYGASQLFGAVGQFVDENPGVEVLVSPSWANGTDILRRFFLPDDAPVQLGSPLGFIGEQMDLPSDLVIVATGEEYPKLLKSSKLAHIRVEQILPYPDGTDGFFFLHMAYSGDAAALFASEEAERRRPITESIAVGGQPARVTHPHLDSGNVGHIFDGDRFTLARGYDANPLDLQVEFATPRLVNRIIVTTGSMDYELSLALYRAEGGEPVMVTETFRGLPDDPTVDVTLGAELGPLRRIDLSFRDLNAGTIAKIHLREIEFE